MTRNRPLIAGVALVAVAVVVGIGVVAGRSVLHLDPRASASQAPTPSSSVPDRSTGVALVATSHIDGAFDVAQAHEPTGGPAQSKLWFAEGAWWATLVDPATQELHIGRLDPGSQTWSDTGTLIDERLHVRADALWDGTHLTIATAGSKPTANQALRISQFHFDAKTGRFAIDSVGGAGDAHHQRARHERQLHHPVRRVGRGDERDRGEPRRSVVPHRVPGGCPAAAGPADRP